MNYNLLIAILSSALVFLLSMIIGPYYVGGDQSIYREVYANFPKYGIIDGLEYFRLNLTSKEPGYFLLAWLGSRIFDKDFFMSAANGLLAFFSIKLILRWGGSILVAGFFVLTNYYMYIFYFAAERLKFSFLFVILGFLYAGQKKFFVFSGLSLLTHAQSFIIYISLFFKQSLLEIKHIFVEKKIRNKAFLIVGLGLLLMVGVMWNHIIWKLKLTLERRDGFSFDIREISRLLVFLILTLLYSKKRLEVFYLFIPLMCAALIIGGERLNLYGYFIFLFYAIRNNKGFNFGIALTSVYFLYKTYFFIEKILFRGTGF